MYATDRKKKKTMNISVMGDTFCLRSNYNTLVEEEVGNQMLVASKTISI